ncbi:MAG: hypothetical protein J0L98_02005 [Zoogloea sp.]|nr:hypothetical protein [Zoogloea sp.]
MQMIKSARRSFAAAGALVAGSISAAHAALPSGVESALTTAGDDAKLVGVAVFVVLVGIFAIKLMRRGL